MTSLFLQLMIILKLLKLQKTREIMTLRFHGLQSFAYD